MKDHPAMKQVCGRPLGLKFNEATWQLYIVYAYFGLMVVGRNGGVAKQLAISVEGVLFRFINALDIDQNCYTLKPGDPVNHRQPVETCVSHIIRLIHE